MSERDYYEVLGVAREASKDEIKKAYRQAALANHPDRNPDDAAAEERFKEATEAYQILSDSNNRQKYDQFGHAAFRSGGGYGDPFSFAEDIFGDIFGAFFGGGSSVQSGRDLRFNLEITLEEAAAGIDREIVVPKPVLCEECSGSGAKKGTSPETCKQCGGSGQIRMQQGFFAISRPCSVCGGVGQLIIDPCSSCSGHGQVTKDAKLSVKIPAGIDEGQRLKLRGEGEPAPQGGIAGDLFIVIHIKPHETFRREGSELLCQIPITYTQAVLGGEIDVPTLDGSTKLKIPQGTPAGKIFRLRGEGVMDLHSGRRGDQHVQTYIYVPAELDDKQRELLEELATIEGEPQAHESRSFFDKVKDLFD